MTFVRLFVSLFLILFQAVIADEAFKPDLTVMIPMRDGKELPTDIYLPHSDAEKLPCILIRTPAGRQMTSIKAYLPLTKQGYIVAVQETRSSLDKEGKTLPYWSDGWGKEQDGYDAVEWLAKSKFSNGKIGTVGNSALGITQLFMAPSAPPSLKCQYMIFAPSSLYHHAIFPNGQLCKNQVEGWLSLHAKDPAVLQCVHAQPFYNAFWGKFDTLKVVDRVKVPAIHYGGWYDPFLQGTIDGFVARQNHGGEGAKGKQKLVLGPWTHIWPFSSRLGDFEVPETGRSPSMDISPGRWFDYHLKELKNGIDVLPTVSYYVMGPFDGSPSSGNIWRHTDTWPVPAKATSFYLTSDKKLSSDSSSVDKMDTFSYKYDPSNPVPTVGGSNLFLESGPKDQRSIEERDDVLVFTTDVLSKDIEVTGKVLAKLYLSAEAPRVDVAIRLSDVYPDGRSILIADGIARSVIADSGKPQPIDLDLWSTSIVFAKGHRIRISISSSNYPRYEKDLSVADGKIVLNKLHIGGNNKSQLILPVVL